MAFHALSGEDTSCEQAWGQAAPAQPQLPHRLHGGEEDNPEPGLHPKPVLPSGAPGERRWQRAPPAGDRFWCSPGLVLWHCQAFPVPPSYWKDSVEGLLPSVWPSHPWAEFPKPCGLPCCAPWTAWPTTPDAVWAAVGSPVPLCQHQSSSCTSHVFLSQSFEAEIFFLGRCHECTEQLPELGSDRAAQGALMTQPVWAAGLPGRNIIPEENKSVLWKRAFNLIDWSISHPCPADGLLDTSTHFLQTAGRLRRNSGVTG